ncbi:MAG: GNAT family N-acetyltransferase [Devosia sp.]
MGGVILKIASSGDIADVAGIFARSRAAALSFLPVLHSGAEDIAFFGRYLDSGLITLAVRAGAKLGFMAEMPGWIEQLYLEPAQRGRGVGKLLVDAAKRRQDRLQLWCFRDNLPGRNFYARQGFIEVGHTDGDNEEGLPDILFAWDR